jgi:hypothetical protein
LFVYPLKHNGRRSQISRISWLSPEFGHEKAVHLPMVGPQFQPTGGGHKGSQGGVRGGRFDRPVGMALQKVADNGSVLRLMHGAGGINGYAAGPHPSLGPIEQISLNLHQLGHGFRSLSPTGIGPTMQRPQARTGHIKQEAIALGGHFL